MNIPLDNLYHWIQGLAQHPVILYVFHPHGSKDIFDLDQLKIYQDSLITPVMICHDQEPLNFSEYEFDHDMNKLNRLFDKRLYHPGEIQSELLLYSNPLLFPRLHPNWLKAAIPVNDWFMLLHSEKNSVDVDKFAHVGFLPVYYWSHAVIARDWYRFAQHDRRLDQRCIEKTFLVYCRDWTPNREYRLKFLELLVSSRLFEDCIVSTQHTNNQDVNLVNYQAQDSRFVVDAQKVLCIPDNNSLPSASADYDVGHITSTAVSVVLETVADGDKIHLTEKILRSIACAHPFVIMAGPGALEYLRSYGFQTFDQFWDESYDAEPDTVKRMEMIIETMHEVKQLTQSDWIEVNRVAEYNKQHFFSQDFIQQVTTELQTNLNHAIDFCRDNRGETYWTWRRLMRQLRLINNHPFFKDDTSRISIQELRKHRSGRFHNKSVPIIGQ
jgi:hypothetical protein